MSDEIEWGDDDPEKPSKWTEREFILCLVTIVAGMLVLWNGSASAETEAFVKQLMLVATGGFTVSRGLAKIGNGKPPAGGVS